MDDCGKLTHADLGLPRKMETFGQPGSKIKDPIFVSLFARDYQIIAIDTFRDYYVTGLNFSHKLGH